MKKSYFLIFFLLTSIIFLDGCKNITKTEFKYGAKDKYSEKAWEMLENLYVDSAIVAFTLAIDVIPENANDASLFRGRGDARLLLNDLDGALSDYNKSIELDNTVSTVFVNRAVLKKRQGYYKDALSDYDIAIKLDDEDADTYTDRAIIHYYLKDYSATISDLDRSISLSKTNPNAYYYRGIFHHEKSFYKKAIDDYTHSINLIYTIVPDKIEHNFSSSGKEELSMMLKDLYQNRADCWNNLKQYENAISDYESLLDVNDIFKENNAMVYQYIALCKVNLRNWSGALQDAKRSVELGNKKAEMMVTSIEDLLSNKE